MVPESQTQISTLTTPSTTEKFVSDLEGLRGEILNRMLNGTSIVATIAFLIAVIFESRIGQWNIILAASIAYAGLLSITLLRRLPYWARTASLLAIIYGMGLTGLLVNGLAGTGRIFLFFFHLAICLIHIIFEQKGMLCEFLKRNFLHLLHSINIANLYFHQFLVHEIFLLVLLIRVKFFLLHQKTIHRRLMIFLSLQHLLPQ